MKPTGTPSGGDQETTARLDNQLTDSLPFPTEAWRSMLTPVRRSPGSSSRRKEVHPAEAALAEVERRFGRAVISINELLDSTPAQEQGTTTDDWRPRAA
ncbi:MAG: hypothetical protein KF787_00620 [Phycisphaeraceae bacterium]|nr:hypothetical protein [Phycisphaerae bacterium]MBX3391126.1 hypothetical protein [Phycisphaeraceae bacterium]HRJ50802.1 hypothetical protein [Phycisphaerales bacterium]